jgi:hypothetical protein
MNDCVSLPDNPHAGPNEQRLRRLVTSSVADLDKAITEWKTGSDALSEVASSLNKQAEQLVEGYGRTGEIVAQSYRTLAKNVIVREDEMKNVVLGLQDARKVVVESGPREFNGLPDVADPPDTDVMSVVISARWDRFDQQRSAREAKAAEALRTLDGEFQTAATRMGAPTPDDTNYTNSSEPAGSSGPLSTRSSGSVKPVTPGLITSQETEQHPVDDGGLVITTPTDPGTGHTSGDEHPTTSTGTISSPGTSTGSIGSTAVGGGAGAVAALGAGAVSGAGSVMASRVGAPVGAVPTGATGSTGAIGRSATTTSGGALGRGGMGALPGQSSAPGGRATGAGGGSRAGGRGVVPGATQTAGRSGKRGEEREGQTDHFEYDDSRGWLDDEATSEPVID